ncbi:hypothetical protein QBC46DRAFT_58446 [Diplogelasinospora grovesii]|uniref:Geranylgeranyl pyrophosphate synthetase n=1 Tax=Diplogelasinospora grovesii TaxID=303347 RepID=A0AAN6S0B9_9PEZI|nr:hypothetical protein QBC46DRAFT_58446 [Diplogelasinospora grovesii]
MSIWTNTRTNRGRGGFKPWNPRPSASASPSTPPPPLGALLASIRETELLVDASSTATISDCKTVTSYNWLDRPVPTIVIPGKPPRWTPLDRPRRLEQDKGPFFRDQNGARYPEHPIEPAVVAALSASPNLPGEVDIVACGSTLGNLLRFVSGKDKQFRILVEVVGNTVFFIRRENSPGEVIQGVKGFGHAFPEAYTTWDPAVKGSVSHQRLIRYNLGGLELLVRFEGDGYISPTSMKPAPSSGSKTVTTSSSPGSVEELIGALAENKVSQEKPLTSSKLCVTSGGEIVSQDNIFGLKTRSVWWKYKQDTLGDELPRLWVAQISKFIMAYHTDGVFSEMDIQVRDVRQKVTTWERDNADTLSRLVGLIRRIVTLVKNRPDGKLELRHGETGVLEVRKQLSDAGSALSAETMRLWEKGLAVEEKRERSEAEDYGDLVRDWDEGSDAEKDYAACSAECGWCGRCDYSPYADEYD